MNIFKSNHSSRKGFTLVELLVVIGILAVLAAIAIPSVAGLIEKGNVSTDTQNANEMSNAIERWVGEYEVYIAEVNAGTVDSQDPVAAVSKTLSRRLMPTLTPPTVTLSSSLRRA